MKYYTHYEFDGKDSTEVFISEEGILGYYWDYWCDKMYNVGRGNLITEERCIEDYCIVHWAVEIEEYEYNAKSDITKRSVIV